jgi:hypothetical protein
MFLRVGGARTLCVATISPDIYHDYPMGNKAFYFLMGVVALFMGTLGFLWVVLEVRECVSPRTTLVLNVTRNATSRFQFRDKICCTAVLVFFFGFVLNNAHRVYTKFFFYEEISHTGTTKFSMTFGLFLNFFHLEKGSFTFGSF